MHSTNHTLYYFAYGSNLNIDDLAAWTQRTGNELTLDTKNTRKAFLPDYRLAFTRYSRNRQGGVLDVVADKGHVVPGVLFPIREEQLTVLDQKEGAPNAYRRLPCRVVDMRGRVVEAVTYEVVEKQNFVRPHDNYVDIVRRGYTYFHVIPTSMLDDAVADKPHALPVFVYGTLKRGFSRHQSMLEHGGAFMGNGETAAQMFDTGFGYPCVTLGAGRCSGELYASDEESFWKFLDTTEGYDGSENSLFLRRLRWVKGKSTLKSKASPILSWIYCVNAAQGIPIVQGGWPMNGDIRTFGEAWLKGLRHDLRTGDWSSRLRTTPPDWYAADVIVTSRPKQITGLDEYYGKLSTCRPDAACITWLFYALFTPLRAYSQDKFRLSLGVIGDRCIAAASSGASLEVILEQMLQCAEKILLA